MVLTDSDMTDAMQKMSAQKPEVKPEAESSGFDSQDVAGTKPEVTKTQETTKIIGVTVDDMEIEIKSLERMDLIASRFCRAPFPTLIGCFLQGPGPFTLESPQLLSESDGHSQTIAKMLALLRWIVDEDLKTSKWMVRLDPTGNHLVISGGMHVCTIANREGKSYDTVCREAGQRTSAGCQSWKSTCSR